MAQRAEHQIQTVEVPGSMLTWVTFCCWIFFSRKACDAIFGYFVKDSNVYVSIHNCNYPLLCRKECEKLPDSVSDAASNYALEEVLSKYNDSTANADNTVEQESTDIDESGKILTKQWNIPGPSSLKNSVRTPSLALMRDQKGNVSLEVQHDLLYICDKKLPDKPNDQKLMWWTY